MAIEALKSEKKFFETEDSFKVSNMVRCLITEGHSVRIKVVQNNPLAIDRRYLYVIYQEDKDE